MNMEDKLFELVDETKMIFGAIFCFQVVKCSHFENGCNKFVLNQINYN